jgi:hypothetical protein
VLGPAPGFNAKGERVPDDPPIPDFLRRTKEEANRLDKEAAKVIQTEQAEHKQAKARARIEKMKAKQRGDLKRMPLSGKEALAAINAE